MPARPPRFPSFPRPVRADACHCSLRRQIAARGSGEIDMGPTFWIGLAIGAIVSLIASLFANYFTPTFSDFMNRRRASFVERSRKKALRKYAEVEELQSGKSDRYFFMIKGLGMIICYLFMINLAFILSSFIRFDKPDKIYFFYILFAIMLFLLIRVGYIMLNMSLMQSRLADFEGYKQKLVKQWGSVEQPS